MLRLQRTLVPLSGTPDSYHLIQVREERPRVAATNQLDPQELKSFILDSPHHWVIATSVLASEVLGALAAESSVAGWREEVRLKREWMLSSGGGLKVAEFFCGMGGTSIGIKDSGFARVSFASDFSREATAVFQYVLCFCDQTNSY